MFFGRRDMFLLSVFTFVTAVAWIVFDVYHSSIDTTISGDTEAKLAPVSPTFDETVIEDIKARQNVEPLNLRGIQSLPVSATEAGSLLIPATSSTSSAQQASPSASVKRSSVEGNAQ